VGLSAIHFHDLRHTSNNWAAEAGATLAELKQRLGHDSDRAASIYLHSTEERQHTIADALSDRARRELRRRDARADRPVTGTDRSDPTPTPHRARDGHAAPNGPVTQGTLVRENLQTRVPTIHTFSGAKGTRTPNPLLAKDLRDLV
jgi:hypothetical protein